MATAEIKAVITADDQASSVVGKFGDNIAGVGATLAVAGAAMVGFGVLSFNAFAESEKQSRMLEHAVIGVTHATREQLQQTEDLATALEKKGVLDADNIKQGLAQLSTFGLSNKAVQALGGSLADLAVNQFGVSASGEQLSDSANMIAKALNGQFGILEKSGIRFTAAQKAIIEFGTEEQKVAAINEGFAQNLKYTNDIARKTAEGAIAALNVSFGNMLEAIGGVIAKALVPLLEKIKPVVDALVDWASKNPQLVTAIIGVGAAIAVATLAVGALALAFAGLDAVASPWLGIAALIVAGIVALGFAVNWLANTFGGWSVVLKEVTDVFNTYIKPALLDVWNTIQTQLLPVLQEFWNQNKNWLIPALQGLAIILGVVIVGSILVFLVAVKMIVQGLTALVSVINWVQAQVRSLIGSFNSLPSQFQAIGGAILQALIWPFQTAFTIISAIFSAIRSSAGSIANIATGGLLQARAGGGSVSGGQPYIVGEQGPELFVPGASGSIVPNNKLGGGGGNQTTININVGLMTGSAIERREAAAKMFEDLKDIAGMQGQTVGQMIGT